MRPAPPQLAPVARPAERRLDRIDELVSNLNVLSKGAQTLAFVRQTPPAFNMLVDPVEVADQAYAGSGEFMLGWWQIRTSLAEPARQWVELLEGRFPRARQR